MVALPRLPSPILDTTAAGLIVVCKQAQHSVVLYLRVHDRPSHHLNRQPANLCCHRLRQFIVVHVSPRSPRRDAHGGGHGSSAAFSRVHWEIFSG
jgi:hypothetical protein